MTEAMDWPPFCGAESVVYEIRKVDGGIMTYPGVPLWIKEGRPAPAVVASTNVEVRAICTRACHPNTEQHVDVERGVRWIDYLNAPFKPSSSS